MKIIPLFFIAGLSALTLATVATSQSLRSDANRPTDLIAPDLGVSESTFIECFGDVLPARNFAPSGQRKRENKAKLDEVVPGLAAQRDDVFVGFEDPVRSCRA